MREDREYISFLFVLAVIAMFAAGMLTGCTSGGSGSTVDVPNSIPGVSTSIEQSKAHVVSAEAAVNRAKPQSSSTGQALLDVASEEHGKAVDSLARASQELAAVTEERDELAGLVRESNKTILRQATEIAALKDGWGYRLQQTVHYAWVIIKWVVGMGILGLIILRSVAPIFTSGAVKGVLNVADYLLHWIATGGIGLVSDVSDWFATAAAKAVQKVGLGVRALWQRLRS